MADEIQVQVATHGARLAALEREVDRLDTSMKVMDDHGTRGVGVLQLQVTELSKDVVRFEQLLEREQDVHRNDLEKVQEVSNHSVRRMLIGVIALLSPVYVAIIVAIVTGQLKP